MIPSVLCYQLNKALKDYIETTFPVSTPKFTDTITNLLNQPGKVFQDPFLLAQLPFKVTEKTGSWFDSLDIDFTPYVHQVKAFERLTGSDLMNTLIATGTGSGKTECFLYPVLDYCWQHRGEPGVKALIIYPMNALATDQAMRLAKTIYHNPNLRGNVKAGMYVGEMDEVPSTTMQESRIITDRETLRKNPPDILLTNYKMLDYLLIRPQDASLWKDNGDETMKFLVVDEFHTFDGAQGTDLACLIRRLKSRLSTPDNYLSCIGTSATMGAGSNSQELVDYAEKVFAEKFGQDSVITEDRLSAKEFNNNSPRNYFQLPDLNQSYELMNLATGTAGVNKYISKAYEAWFKEIASVDEVESKNWRVKLADKLNSHAFFQDLITALEGRKMKYEDIIEKVQNSYPELENNGADYARAVLDSMIALVSYARKGVSDQEGSTRPFLQIHLQLWFRELRRMMASIDSSPVLEFSDDINDQQKERFLPVVNCRDCGATGWTTIIKDSGSATLADLSLFYNLYFKFTEKIAMLFPVERYDVESSGDQQLVKICSGCATVNADFSKEKCGKCGSEKMIFVENPELKIAYDSRKRARGYICPYCSSGGGLTLIGAQGATLISAGISQLFSSSFNDDKKMLAFSDSVQDASHRASFFNARTWRFNLRTAIQQFVNNGGNGLSLDKFPQEFINYWRQRMKDEEFVSTFIAPDQTWRKAFEDMVSSNKLTGDSQEIDSLFTAIEKRLDVEIIYEYGYNAKIGRTLEKSGASVLAFDEQLINQALEDLYVRATNEIGELRNIGKEELEKLVAGFLVRLKNNGGIYRDFLYQYIYGNGDSFRLTSNWKKWLPSQARGRELPRFITYPGQGLKNNSFDIVNKKSWFYKWVEKNLGFSWIREDLPLELIDIIIKELTNSDILTEIQNGKGGKVWGIAPNALEINNLVIQIKCSRCGHSLSVPKKEEKIWEGMPCHHKTCDGNYIYKESGLDFYGHLFNTGEICRVFAQEHTGLLERKDREELEKEFKKAREAQYPWETNILSCTPTLEMGISIGDLSTIFLCSVPPSQTQYLQRVGRAGRRDGNALSAVVANATPHDLYFYGEPEEMIASEIEPPKIFLDASAVLERQFVAYCFDSWVNSGISSNAVPEKLSAVLRNMEKQDMNVFPYNFLNYIETHFTKLVDNFLNLFQEDIDDDTATHIRRFAIGKEDQEGTLGYRIIDTFNNIYNERESIRKESRKITEKINKLKKEADDISIHEQIKELEIEKDALKKVVRSINEKNTYNFFTDEGLIPNYAFPEAGIILKTVLLRKFQDEYEEQQVKSPQRKYKNYVYEFSRPAASAIHELAPENYFYAGGRKNKIDRVDMNMSEPENWRLCPNCSHSQLEIPGKDTSVCPKCGDLGWADKGQLRQMLRLRMVYSNEDYVKSRSGDESEQREEIYYCRQMLVDVDPEKNVKKAYMADDERNPFGFEYADKADLREINFGEKEEVGERFSVAGKLDYRKGFRICKYCGKVQGNNSTKNHVRTCRNYGKESNQLINDDINDCFYLYRDFSTEVLRIFVPAVGFDDSEVRLHSFTASVLLGLKLHFGGVDHLKTCHTEEPVPESLYRKNYLVIYDAVPGGTGYLEELVRSSDTMMKLLENALKYIQACDCKDDPGKDGCYRCLYGYKQSRHIGSISRTVAIEILNRIIKNKDNMQEIKTINDISVNSLFDSELERRFLEALQRRRSEKINIELKKQIVNDKPGYLLKIEDQLWEIEPQVDLGPEAGVVVRSKADFVFWPVRNKDQIKPVVVFTDGYVYHKDRIAQDTAQRMAIIKSNRFIVWSLSWKDVENVFAYQGGNYYKDYPEIIKTKNLDLYNKLIASLEVSNLGRITELDNFELLLKLLAQPEDLDIWRKLSFSIGICATEPQKHNNYEEFQEWQENLKEHLPGGMNLPEYLTFGQCAFGQISLSEDNFPDLEVYAGVVNGKLQENLTENIFLLSLIEDREDYRSNNYEACWNGYLKVINLFQFLHNSLFLTKTGIEEAIYTEFEEGFGEDQLLLMPADSGSINGWMEVKQCLIENEFIELSKILSENGVRPPDVIGYELSNDNAEILGMAEMVWHEEGVALLDKEEAELDKLFENNGWKVYVIDNENLNSTSFIDNLILNIKINQM